MKSGTLVECTFIEFLLGDRGLWGSTRQNIRSQVWMSHNTCFINSTNIDYVPIMFQGSAFCVENKAGYQNPARTYTLVEVADT